MTDTVQLSPRLFRLPWSAWLVAVVLLATAWLAPPALTASETAPAEDVPSVPQLDLTRYAGSWYEIARLPNRWQEGMAGVVATYSLDEDGDIAVRNSGRAGSLTGAESASTATAWRPDEAHPARLYVRFFWPFKADYWVTELDPGYQWAVVGQPSRDHLWILSRSPTLDRALLDRLIANAKRQGFAMDQLSWTAQDPAAPVFPVGGVATAAAPAAATSGN